MNSARHNNSTMAPNQRQIEQRPQANQPPANQPPANQPPNPIMLYALDALECVIARIAQDDRVIIRPVPRGILRELQHEHGRDIQLMACYCPDGFHGGQQCERCDHRRGDLHCACPACQRFKA
jgi:hypothetical protein